MNARSRASPIWPSHIPHLIPLYFSSHSEFASYDEHLRSVHFSFLFGHHLLFLPFHSSRPDEIPLSYSCYQRPFPPQATINLRELSPLVASHIWTLHLRCPRPGCLVRNTLLRSTIDVAANLNILHELPFWNSSLGSLTALDRFILPYAVGWCLRKILPNAPSRTSYFPFAFSSPAMPLWWLIRLLRCGVSMRMYLSPPTRPRHQCLGASQYPSPGLIMCVVCHCPAFYVMTA